MSIKKTISILFVTDDRNQPFSIKFRLFWFKFLVGLGICGSVIFVAGIIVYFKLVSIALDYHSLQERYAVSLKENNQIVGLMKKFAQIQSIDAQIRTNLGIQLGIGGEPLQGVETIEWDPTLNVDSEYPSFPRTFPVNMQREFNLVSIPSLLPVKGFITRGFFHSLNNTGEDHLGIDIVAREGSVVSAAGDGIVLFSNWTYESGHNIIIDHGNGYLSFYKHNKRNLATERQVVHRGDPIAFLGNSGLSSGPHLHFEVWKDGKPADPKSLILNI